MPKKETIEKIILFLQKGISGLTNNKSVTLGEYKIAISS
jgi:hypothetical protein